MTGTNRPLLDFFQRDQLDLMTFPSFPPPSPAAVRSVLQVLHGCCERAVKAAVIPGSGLEWAQHYNQQIDSDRFCLNEWEAMNDLESVRRDSDGQRSEPCLCQSQF